MGWLAVALTAFIVNRIEDTMRTKAARIHPPVLGAIPSPSFLVGPESGLLDRIVSGVAGK